MKKIVFAISIIVLVLGCGSMPASEPVENTEIVKILDTGKDKDNAFDLSMKWISATFKSSKAVIEYNDKTAGTINGKGYVSVQGGLGIPVDVNFALVIDLKDNRARMSFKALSTVVQTQYGPRESGIYPQIFDEFKSKVEEMATSYQSYLTSTSTDW